MDAYAANTVMAASPASSVGCNYQDGSGCGAAAGQTAEQNPSDTLPLGSRINSADALKLRRRRFGGNTATIALIVAALALAVAVAK